MPRARPNILFCEGTDDTHLLAHLCASFGYPEYTFYCEDAGGYERLRRDVVGYLVGTEVRRLGVVIDANQSPLDRWRSITSRLQEYGYSHIPEQPNPSGTVIPPEGTSDGRPTVGIWMWPDNRSQGTLEHFVSRLIRDVDRLWPRARSSVDAIPDADRRFKRPYLMKAYVHTWLAWQEEPGTPLGRAVTRHYLDATLPGGQGLRTWLDRLLAGGS